MFRVMIIDDEAYFREYLQTLIPWSDYGFEICGEACNGEEGLKKVSLLNPDIILADIHMPVVNGLDFSKTVKEKFPYVHIILITGFNEFEYAKQAIRIGVANYISKPFTKEELVESILSLKKTIESQRQRETYIDRLEKQNCEKFPLLRRNLLYNTVKGMYEDETELLREELKTLKIVLPDPPFITAIMEVKSKKPEFPENSVRESIAEKMISIVHGALYKEFKFVCFNGDDDQLVLIAGITKTGTYASIIRKLNEIIRTANIKIRVTVTIGVGTECEKLSDIRISYEKAGIAIKNGFLLNGNRVIEFGALRIEDTSGEIFPFKLKNDLFIYLRLADGDKINATLDQIYDSLKGKRLPIDYVYILYTELLSMCFSSLAERGVRNEDVFGADFFPFQDIVRIRTIEEVHAYVRGIYGRMEQYLANNTKANSSKIINRAKEYIDQNYNRSGLVIEEIASSVFYHPSYLRFLFKKETGMTVGEYLTQVRMAKAKELLKNRGLRCVDVATMVGYSDATYFSKCFKKFFKISPFDYEKSVSNRS